MLSKEDIHVSASDYGNIGIVLRQIGQPKEALDLLENSLKIFNEFGAVTRAKRVKEIIAALKKTKN